MVEFERSYRASGLSGSFAGLLCLLTILYRRARPHRDRLLTAVATLLGGISAAFLIQSALSAAEWQGRSSFEYPSTPALRPSTGEDLQRSSEAFVFQKTGWRKDSLMRLRDVLFGGPGRGFKGEDGRLYYADEIFLVLLHHVTKGVHFDACVDVFGGSLQKWSGAYKSLLAFIHNRFSRRLMFFEGAMSMFTDSLPTFNDAINNRMERKTGFIPRPGEDTIAGLLDTTWIAVPKSTLRNLADGHFSLYRKSEGLKVLTPVWPDGMVGGIHMAPGRASDCFQATDSDVSEVLHRMSVDVDGIGGVYSLYADQIFARTGFIKTPNHVDGRNWSANFLNHPPNLAYLNRLRLQDRAMKTIRVPVENNYAGAKGGCHILNEKRKLQVGNSSTNQLVAFCFFLMNCKCCCEGNNVSMQFNLTPPVLEDYLEKLESIV